MLILTLASVIVPSILNAMGLESYVRQGINTLMIPAQKLFRAGTDAIEGFTSYFTKFDSLKEENKALREELQELKNEIYHAGELENMNDWLFSYLELKRQHTDFKFESAKITGESGNYITVYTLDAGSRKGIKTGMPVVTSDGIVGFVTEVGTSWCKAVSLIEASTSTGALVERTGEIGLVTGDFNLASDGLCKLIYLDSDSDIKEGDRILTSGYGGVYPKGLVIGYVSAVEADPYSRTITAYIKPAVALDSVSSVMIVTEYDEYSE